MNVLVMGITTELGKSLGRALLARGDTPVGLVHDDAQQPGLRALGIGSLVVNESGRGHDEAWEALTRAHAVVLATGSGMASGSLGAAGRPTSPVSLLMAGAEMAGVRRFALVSAMHPGDEVLAALGDDVDAYLEDKRATERALRERDLDWCVLRPGMLDDSVATGRVTVDHGEDPQPTGPVSRADLAAVVCGALVRPEPVRGVFAVSTGDMPVADVFAPGAASHRTVDGPGGH